LSLFDSIFDPAYRKGLNQATREVPLLKFLYLTSIPLAKLLAYLGLRPNTITSISNVVALVGIGTVLWAENPWYFPLLWILALLFDMADGIVARVTGQSSASGSFYDHMSDQVKVILLFLAVGLRYDNLLVWVLVYSTNALFLFMGVVNQVCAVRTLKLAQTTSTSTPGFIPEPGSAAGRGSGIRAMVKHFLAGHPRLKKWALGSFASIFVMYGNSMILVLPLSFGETWAIGTMLFFSLVTLRSLLVILRTAAGINRGLQSANASWK
jgi:hypothetical protein